VVGEEVEGWKEWEAEGARLSQGNLVGLAKILDQDQRKMRLGAAREGLAGVWGGEVDYGNQRGQVGIRQQWSAGAAGAGSCSSRNGKDQWGLGWLDTAGSQGRPGDRCQYQSNRWGRGGMMRNAEANELDRVVGETRTVGEEGRLGTQGRNLEVKKQRRKWQRGRGGQSPVSRVGVLWEGGGGRGGNKGSSEKQRKRGPGMGAKSKELEPAWSNWEGPWGTGGQPRLHLSRRCKGETLWDVGRAATIGNSQGDT